jgi:hypothetical protein
LERDVGLLLTCEVEMRMMCLALAVAAALCGCGARVVVEAAPAECDSTVECHEDADCDDGDDCTADRCSPDGACAHSDIGGCESA